MTGGTKLVGSMDTPGIRDIGSKCNAHSHGRSLPHERRFAATRVTEDERNWYALTGCGRRHK
jgi:hypothetical protein